MDNTIVEFANKIAQISGGKVWEKSEIVRIYFDKGYAEFGMYKGVLALNIDKVGGHFFEAVKSAAQANGITTYRA